MLSQAIDLIIKAIIFILPAYVANATPVIFKGKIPIDLNCKFFDGKPILGKHKTIRGFISGILAGSLVGFLQQRFLIGFLMASGAMIGDLAGSFIKRRFDIEPGASLPVIDQLGFLAGALLFSLIVIIPPPELIITLVLITPPLHVSTNVLANVLGLKKTL